MSEKLNVFVCENFYPEYKKVLEKEKYKDVELVTYPCLCGCKNRKEEAAALIDESVKMGRDAVVFCGKHCDILDLIPEGEAFDVRSSNFCFIHLANEPFVTYIIENGGYIIGSGWLKNWRERIAEAGFDQKEAKEFYQNFCKEIVFFDTGVAPESATELKQLSAFVGVPYKIIPVGLEMIEQILDCAIFEWKQRRLNERSKKALHESRVQCAEYNAIFDLMGKIVMYTNKRDTIGGLKNLFSMVFGAEDFRYWNNETENTDFPDNIKEFFSNKKKPFFYSKEEGRFCIKIERGDKVYGAIEIGGFLFPEHTEKYLDFAIGIAMICGLIFDNIEQYEKIKRAEEAVTYLNFHDPLTELYNRSYINDYREKNPQKTSRTVFTFDIDRLKYVNDTFGDAAGDNLIKGVAWILKRSFRDNDILARIGGDEFLAILPEADRELAERIRCRIAKEITQYNKTIEKDDLKISLSTGFAVAEKDLETLETLIQQADQFMYIDKMAKRRWVAENNS